MQADSTGRRQGEWREKNLRGECSSAYTKLRGGAKKKKILVTKNSLQEPNFRREERGGYREEESGRAFREGGTEDRLKDQVR